MMPQPLQIRALNPKNVNTVGTNDATSLMVVAAGHGDVATFVNKLVKDLKADVKVAGLKGLESWPGCRQPGRMAGRQAGRWIQNRTTRVKWAGNETD